ncbi:FecCD family ABC transporter permease [Lysinibacillus sphaericus]|uniref:Transport system permease n=1 Tax=Lysinibacillus sphaericus OT4b.31 TaxID=1285586 RepID=R7ZKC1_LYSSH|nr:iron chelate uptake ABC transporter family permease subunit [Lysinibacillus sphaericus]EON74552.1 transport system permease [Lysinibacillus sphaericus OT4b.31]
MKKQYLFPKNKFILLSILLLLLLFISITFAIMIGSVSITPLYVWKVILSKIPLVQNWIEQDWSRSQEIIIWQIRVPRVLLAAIVGGGLAIAGAAIQALVRNSIADPYILGVSSGATVGATAVIILGAFSFLGIYALSIAAFLGSLLAIVLVFFLSRVGGRISIFRLLLAGMAVSFILSATSNFILMMSKQEGGMKAVMYWMLGSLAGAKWNNLLIPTIIFVVVFALLWLHYRNLNLLLLGEEAAVTLGVNLQQFRIQLVVLVSLLTGVLVAVSGSIGFVGLIIPHIVRLIIGSNYKYVIPISALLGAIFLVWADALARILIAPEEMPIGIITAFCGGPFFIWLLRRNNYSFGEGD